MRFWHRASAYESCTGRVNRTYFPSDGSRLLSFLRYPAGLVLQDVAAVQRPGTQIETTNNVKMRVEGIARIIRRLLDELCLESKFTRRESV